MSQEDDMVSAIINSYRNSYRSLINVEPEAHYNHYGDRGVADLYIVHTEDRTTENEGAVFEVKADSAVQEATGANEIIRQYNRMRRNFFRYKERVVHTYCKFELCFVISERTVRHVCENFEMYASTSNSQINAKKEEGLLNTENVVFRLPDANNYTPAAFPIPKHVDSPSEWKEFLSKQSPKAVNKVSRILNSLGY
ncbi:MAG: hypothetical protein J07HX64_01014 [halophilic archaeon J07HX64]|jgi:hypothetical protein|nr:MAG: hypothetical protein J07HX64_01014 [halophilic archaeon J07HX64]